MNRSKPRFGPDPADRPFAFSVFLAVGYAVLMGAYVFWRTRHIIFSVAFAAAAGVLFALILWRWMRRGSGWD